MRTLGRTLGLEVGRIVSIAELSLVLMCELNSGQASFDLDACLHTVFSGPCVVYSI